jgi:hypothetical protein
MLGRNKALGKQRQAKPFRKRRHHHRTESRETSPPFSCPRPWPYTRTRDFPDGGIRSECRSEPERVLRCAVTIILLVRFLLPH